MKPVYMHQIHTGTTGDIKTFEQHYAKMAERGWMIDKLGLFTQRYRRIEPSRKQFFVDLLPQITMFDYPENEDVQDYRSLCEESGWKFIAANKQFHVFCADEDGGEEKAPPVPIHTDNKIQARIYLKMFFKYEFFAYILFVLIFINTFVVQGTAKGVETFLSDIRTFQVIGYLLFSIGLFWTAGFVFIWAIRVRRASKLDLPMPTVSYKWSRIRSHVFITTAAAALISFFAGFVMEMQNGMPAELSVVIIFPFIGVGVGLWIRKQIDTKRRTRGGNIALLVAAIVIMEIVLFGVMGVVMWRVFSNRDGLSVYEIGNRPVLTLTDIGVMPSNSNNGALINGSVVVPDNYSYWESSMNGNVEVKVYRSISRYVANGLYDCRIDELKNMYGDERGLTVDMRQMTAEEAEFWGADEGFGLTNLSYSSITLVLIRDKTVLRVSASSDSGLDTEAVGKAVRELLLEIERR